MGRKVWLHATVFLTGAAVLVLEILGTKLLSPYFGNNLYVWSALISVTMIALAGGYAAGGRLADAQGSEAILDRVIAGAAVWVAIIPVLVKTVAIPLLDFDYRIGILLTALTGFGPALFLLGFVTPVAVKLAVSDMKHVGRSAGGVYAWGTAGGIFGALAAGFLLFPVISISRICHVTAIMLLALAATRYLSRSRRPLLGVSPLLALLAIGFAAPESFVPSQSWSDGGFQVITDRPSFYGRVRVLESKDYRLMTIDGLVHNAQNVSDGEPALAYVPIFAALPYLRPDAKSALIVGLGGGDMVRLLGKFGLKLTAVEIDPVVVETAFRYFGLMREQVNVFTEDGRLYLTKAKEKFDFVTLDAFSGGCPPSHLLSVEAFRTMKKRLNPAGIVGVNSVVTSSGSPLIADLAATMGEVFEHVIAISALAQEGAPGNVVLFASDSPLDLPSQWAPPPPDPSLVKVFNELPKMLLDLHATTSEVITDSRNFVDALAAPAEIALRRDSLSHLSAALLDP